MFSVSADTYTIQQQNTTDLTFTLTVKQILSGSSCSNYRSLAVFSSIVNWILQNEYCMSPLYFIYYVNFSYYSWKICKIQYVSFAYVKFNRSRLCGWFTSMNQRILFVFLFGFGPEIFSNCCNWLSHLTYVTHALFWLLWENKHIIWITADKKCV